MSCLQRLDALKASNWTDNNVQRNNQRPQSRVLTAQNTLNGTKSGKHSVAQGAHRISYIHLRKFTFREVLNEISALHLRLCFSNSTQRLLQGGHSFA